MDVNKIGNAMKRRQMHEKQDAVKKAVKALERKKRLREREILGDEAPPVAKPRTIESMRVAEETEVQLGDEEVAGEDAMDEYASYYRGEATPKLCITSCLRASTRLKDFMKDLLYVFPNSIYHERNRRKVKDMVKTCSDDGFTDLLIFNEDNKKINGLTVVHLPEGPTCYFKLTNVKLNREIPDAGDINFVAKPEVILNRFTTRMGLRVGRILGALFHPEPFFRGRRVMTFHNQRDYVFFRHHRYVFERLSHADGRLEGETAEEKAIRDKAKAVERRMLLGKKGSQKYRDATRDAPKLYSGEMIINDAKVRARIQEIGPQFTMKLMWLQHGTFDKQMGEYEWAKNNTTGKTRRQYDL